MARADRGRSAAALGPSRRRRLLVCHPGRRRALAGAHPVRRDRARAAHRNGEAPPFAPGWRQFILQEGTEVVGDIGLNWPEHGDYAEIGFELAPSARGRGLAQRAVMLLSNWLLDSANLLGVVAITSHDNVAARTVIEAAGLLPCGDEGLRQRFDLQPGEQLYLLARSADA
jgi:RimJ/RimL family protein N-acetyltransferase